VSGVLGAPAGDSPELEDEEEPGVAGACGGGVCATDTAAHKRAIKPASFKDCMKGFACMNYSYA
jgi:hypothetical protein